MNTIDDNWRERNAKPKFSALDINSLHKTSRVSKLRIVKLKQSVVPKSNASVESPLSLINDCLLDSHLCAPAPKANSKKYLNYGSESLSFNFHRISLMLGKFHSFTHSTKRRAKHLNCRFKEMLFRVNMVCKYWVKYRLLVVLQLICHH